MNDSFKYKVFDIDDKKLHDVILINYENNSVEWYNEADKKRSAFIDEVPLVQCTGLKDKNSKLIFEGDLLRYPAKDKDEETNFVICEVFFHNNDCCDTHTGFQMNRFHFKGNLCGIINYGRKYNFIPKNVEKMEVIGNIYENPELLKEVK